MGTYEDWKASRAEADRVLEHAIRTAGQRGVVVRVYGCGCCSSPVVQVSVDGGPLVEIEDAVTSSPRDWPEADRSLPIR